MTSQRRRNQLVERLREEGIVNEEVLHVIGNMPRHLFVDEAMANRAYEDSALPIGFGQTISQPFIVARMTESVLGENPSLKPRRVLEIGTGSGYQAAVLAMLVERVYTVERIQELHKRAQDLMLRLQLRNVQCKYEDGSLGWPQQAPFDAIIVTAAPSRIPETLLDQLTVGGRMVIPVGENGGTQRLYRIERTADGFVQRELELVSFVPFLSGRDR
ncbi:MAG TPA: protein-L-isoaspartate(D-aspartate) O-methyltransferase [Gammaproteobacteria bacterium]|nr:protein-L-isoaspartate(D-aspartate) O-methyltransferase [Gammaproteobacteria bacterium]